MKYEFIVSNMNLSSEIDSEEQCEEVMEHLIDIRNDRFEYSCFEDESFNIWEKTCAIDSFLKDTRIKRKYYLMPHFLHHFDIRGINCPHVLLKYI